MTPEIILTATYLAVCAVPVGAAWLWLAPRMRRLQKRQIRQEETLERLQVSLDQLGHETAQVNNRSAQFEQEFAQLRERQQRMEPPASSARPYSHAIRLVRGGAQIEDLIAACGLTHAEAELIASIHQHKERSASVASPAGTANVRAAKVSG